MPTVQYLQAMEHANDRIDFQPGDRVTVPFSPRGGDTWQVDGGAPKALPAGHANGRQMRQEAPDSDWAAGQPPGLGPGAPDTSVDTPSSDGGAPAAAPASISTIGPSGGTQAAPVSSTGLRREVFGFLPYWVIGDSTTVLDWNTLSTVAYFSVGCLPSGYLDKTNPDGSLTTGWAGWTSSKMTSIITAAHEHQTRVVLTVSCFAWSTAGATAQAALLGSATARSRLAHAVAAAVRDRGADGVNLDFEPIVAGYSAQFTALVRSIRSALNAVAPGYQLTFDTMGSIGNQPIADATAPGGADAIFIMGYDYRTAGSSTAGSISPLTGPKYDLTDTINAYLAKVPASKLILGVPYYGRAWSTASSALNAATLNPSKYGSSAVPTYDQAMSFVAQYGRRWDAIEQSPWTAYHKQTCTSTYGCVTSWRELYYDDAASLQLRYDLVNRTDLRGAGIWALGYDGTRPELRNAIADTFLADRTPPVTGIVTLAQQQHDEGFAVAWSSWDDSPIAGYDVQVSVDGGAWSAWLTRTSKTSAMFAGHDGHVYAFRDRATDVYGNVSAWKSLAVGNLSAPGSISVGGFATVDTDGLRMRSTPSTAGAVMATLSAGDALQVIGGPVTGEGYTWYEVAGPVAQWAPVDPMQVGGWIAASGNGVINASPRRPVYATAVNAGITGLTLAGGGMRALTPAGGQYGALEIAWTNHVSLDSLALRVFRLDGTVAGAAWIGATGAGSHTYAWDGHLNGGGTIPNGTYILQLQGIRNGVTYSAPSASPVNGTALTSLGIVVGTYAPTSVVRFAAPGSPNRWHTQTWSLTFGGPVSALRSDDFWRTGTATGCLIGTPVGAGAAWTVTLTGCSAGTVTLVLKANAVIDAVHNWGPAAQVKAPTLLIDRSAPISAAPKVQLRSGVSLGSSLAAPPLAAMVTWSATDPGGAGVASYDVRRSVDGAAYTDVALSTIATSMAVSLTPGHTYQFSVRARDRAGNVGAWTAGPTIRAYLPQQVYAGLTWTGTWKSVTDSQCSAGSTKYATGAGASVTYAFTGRSIAWVTTLGADRGAAKVYVDGALVSTLDLHAATTTYRRVAFSKSWASSGNHTLRIVVVGTAGRPRVDVDAFEVVR